MKIKVTAKKDGWLISRLVKTLLKDERFSESVGSINYFFPYYAYNNYKENSVAFFTHREEHPKFSRRREQWDRTAKQVDLRIAMSKPYYDLLSKYGDTVIIEPPITENLRHRVYRFGLAGRFYKSDRKGRDLIKRLNNHPISKYIQFKFTSDPGFGDVKRYKSFKDMENFYGDLDFYLCTSTVEGGPMPVKEAYYCNVPVIAPKNVGFCDKYSTYSYNKNDFNSLVKIVEKIVKPKLSYDQVSPKTWINNHIKVFKSCFQ
jgi:hypothetical protein